MRLMWSEVVAMAGITVCAIVPTAGDRGGVAAFTAFFFVCLRIWEREYLV